MTKPDLLGNIMGIAVLSLIFWLLFARVGWTGIFWIWMIGAAGIVFMFLIGWVIVTMKTNSEETSERFRKIIDDDERR